MKMIDTCHQLSGHLFFDMEYYVIIINCEVIAIKSELWKNFILDFFLYIEFLEKLINICYYMFLINHLVKKKK